MTHLRAGPDYAWVTKRAYYKVSSQKRKRFRGYLFRFEFQSCECPFQALDNSMHLLGEISVLLRVYKVCIVAVGDWFTDLSTILVFVCKNSVILAEFQHIHT